jgi:hypothetical protein
MIKSHSLFAGVIVLLGATAPAAPQTTSANAPDKSDYTLFDPVPDDQMRSFCTDRPTKSNLPCTVDAGHFQYESDIFNWSYAHAGGVTTNTYLFTNPTLKLGLTNRMDLEVNIVPVETVTVKSASGWQNLTGIGDTFVRAKFNLAGPEGGDFQAAVIPFVKFPTARAGNGDGAVEAGVIAPVSFALPDDYTLLFDPEFDVERDGGDFGRHANFQLLANLCHALTNSVSAAAELWGQENADPRGATQEASFDMALSWIPAPNPNLQFDAGFNVGLTPATPKFQPYFGVSQRF